MPLDRITAQLQRLFPGAVRGGGHLERWLSFAGGLIGILGVLFISQYELGLHGSAAVVASMGASAVLLFAVPHGPLSQPWPLLGGHLVSALVGVSCAKLIGATLPAAALAVAGAIVAMHYLRCIHPPGGATALTAVIGGDAVVALGYGYVITPVMLNALCMLAVAILFNLPFVWRRYPAAWAVWLQTLNTVFAGERRPRPPNRRSTVGGATDASARSEVPALQIGRYYCNGAFGPEWQVRRITAITQTAAGGQRLHYKVVAGQGRRREHWTTPAAMRAWVQYEVIPNESSWQRAAADAVAA